MNPSTCTFTTMDTYQGSIFDPTSLHKYLYANADPVMNSDPSGYATLTGTQVAVLGATFIAAAIASISTWAMNVYKKLKISTFRNMEYYFPKAVLTGATIEGLNKIALIVATNVSKLYSEIIVNDVLESVLVGEYEVSYLFSPIHSYISNKIEKLQNDKKSNKRNLHHIVARTSMKAALARSILFKVGIPINSTENLVSIKEFVHWYMHTDVYYTWVNSLIYSSYSYIGDDQTLKSLNVHTTLLFIKSTITLIDSSIN